jgi:outer membrane protein OmpA-like peptidoglycan-associated protein/tetratricopeptide (TPR) repeat protein
MLVRRFLIAIFLFCASLNATAQDNSPLAKAQKLEKSLAFSDAIPLYLKALDRDSNNEKAMRGIAECYRMTNQTEQAEIYYRKLVQANYATPMDKLRLAQVLMSNANYSDAQKYFSEYNASATNDDRAKNQLDAISKLDGFLKDSARFNITTAPLNTANSDFSPAKFADGFVFVSSRERGGLKEKTHSWTGDPYLSLFYAKGNLNSNPNISPFAEELRSEYNDGPVVFGPMGDEMFLTRNNSKLPFRNDKTARLKIVFSKLVDGKWSDPVDLPFNRAQYNMAHACLSQDGKRLYFSSDMPGGNGGMDLYYSDRDGIVWSEPVNLGKKINTTGNDVFPYIAPDGKLYFASDGWPGLGGLDIFKAELENQTEDPLNAGFPINTHKDDFGIWISSDLTQGLLSSNRKGGTGDDDIWSIDFVNKIVIYGIVAERETMIPIPNATVYLKDTLGNVVGTDVTDEQGNYSIKGDFNTSYVVSTNPDGYFAKSESFNTYNATNDSMRVDLLLEKIIINKPIVLENIYYDFDKWNIRPDAAIELDKLVIILKENPKIVIELGSHTDCRGIDAYNIILSQRRAQSAVDYIVTKGGIESSRISAKGYGETQHVNKCKNNVLCTEAEHQQNRRTEFKVVSQ